MGGCVFQTLPFILLTDFERKTMFLVGKRKRGHEETRRMAYFSTNYTVAAEMHQSHMPA
jgi:hypothetical protein